MSSKWYFPLVSVWCGVWPVALTWASVTEHYVASVVAILVLVVTPLALRHREVRAHEECHVGVEKLIVKLQAHYQFCAHEAAASELESLGDSLRSLPGGVFIEPRSLANHVDQRVAQLRARAPDPALTDIFDLVSHEPES